MKTSNIGKNGDTMILNTFLFIQIIFYLKKLFLFTFVLFVVNQGEKVDDQNDMDFMKAPKMGKKKDTIISYISFYKFKCYYIFLILLILIHFLLYLLIHC